jgi:hypothetical protein
MTTIKYCFFNKLKIAPGVNSDRDGGITPGIVLTGN